MPEPDVNLEVGSGSHAVHCRVMKRFEPVANLRTKKKYLRCKFGVLYGGTNMTDFLRRLWLQDEGQDIAEYAVMLAVILVLVVGTIRLIGSSANNVFSATASSIGQ